MSCNEQLKPPLGGLKVGSVSSVYVKSLSDLLWNIWFMGDRHVRYLMWTCVIFQLLTDHTCPDELSFWHCPFQIASRMYCWESTVQRSPKLTPDGCKGFHNRNYFFSPSRLLLLKQEFLSMFIAAKAWTIFKYVQYIWQSGLWPWMTVNFIILGSILPLSPLSGKLPDYWQALCAHVCIKREGKCQFLSQI